jgi:signal transduction histidine kinase
VCGAMNSTIFRLEGEHLRVVARQGTIRRYLTIGDTIPVSRDTVVGRALRDRRTVHVEDIVAAETEFPVSVARMRQAGSETRTMLATPLLREGTPLGVIIISGGSEVHPFSAKQIALLETFANQAVIAIENVRLFQELEARNSELTESLEQQTATSEILRVISQSPTDVQPVFDVIAQRAVNLSDAEVGAVSRFDGAVLQLAALHGVTREGVEAVRAVFPTRLDTETLAARAFRARAVIHVEDVLADPRYQAKNAARAGGWRGALAVPMFRGTEVIGVIFVGRSTARLFTDSQIELLKTFADQAVIAVENVRLFNETKEALEQQTATAEILRVISSSPTDLQPVFDAIVRTAARLCEANYGFLARYDGTSITIAAHSGATDAEIAVVRRGYPMAPTPASLAGRAILERAMVHIPDVRSDPTYGHRGIQEAGWRTGLGVPLLREGAAIGVLGMWRGDVRPFSDRQIALLQTFAAQAVIAIENVRLFTELEARTQDLTRSVNELRALGEVGRAVSSTLDLQTVLTTIASRAVELSGTSGGVIYEHDEATGAFRLRASHQVETELVEVLRGAPFRLGEGVTGRAAALRAPVQVIDLLTEREFAVAHISPIAEGLGYRSILAVPLLLEDRTIGGLTVWRKQPGGFAPEVVHLLQTFAAQSSLALQNARLFREIADKSRQLEAASRHKSEFLANMSHELRTPLNAILGFSEVLTERMFGEVNEKQAEYLQDILSSGRHLLSLINDILDLSKVEAGRLELELGRFHLPTALDNALTLVRERATRHGITLTQHVDPGVGDIVADERKVKQILLNLLSNAVKFTPEGGRVGLTATAVDGVMTITVSDTGIGIAPEDQAAIFEEFRQVGREDSCKQEGTGLGLTLAKKFVELHGGRIGVHSHVGQGSTFTFTLPVRPWPTSAS